MVTNALMAVSAEPMMHVTKMARCRVCGMAVATANPEPGPRTPCAETCPAGHDGDYDGADYYYV
jgi:hypothetical protein